MLRQYKNSWVFYSNYLRIKNNYRLFKFDSIFFKKNYKNGTKKIKTLKSPILMPTDFRKKKFNAEKNLINFLMRGGNFMKSKNFLKKAYAALYKALIFGMSIFFKKKYSFFETLGQIVLHDNTWFIFNNLLTYFILKIKPLFYVRCVSIAKTFKKKKKILRIAPYKFFLRRLAVHKRFNFAVRELSLYIRATRRVYLTDRILLGILDLFMLDKRAFLFKKKIKVYKKALQAFVIEKAIK